MGYARYLSDDFGRADLELSRWLRQAAGDAPDGSRQRAHYLLGWTRLALGDGPAAAEQFKAVPQFPGKRSLLAATATLEALPHRSAWIAALLSIVPGAGHVYIGQPAIGLAALGWNGLFGVGLYDSLRRGDYGVAAVLALFESLWYFGTVFGAVSGAQKYNRDARLNAIERLREQYDDRPESWPPAPPLNLP